MKLSTENHILVIFGGSGDLTKRKLVPALYDLHKKKLLPEKYAIIGVGRTEFTHEIYREHISSFLPVDEEKQLVQEFLSYCYFVQSNFDSEKERESLKLFIKDTDEEINSKGNIIYYLSTPPTLYEKISENLGIAKLAKPSKEFPGWKRLIVEKPFGKDVASAQKLQSHLLKFFREEQIYRIDHYLGKETAQNILVARFYNSIFEPLWNRNHIHHIEITSAEREGIGERAGYYDTAGALRDMLQNHLLQLVALVAMEPPTNFSSNAIRNEVLKVFESLRPLSENDLKKFVIRGQYAPSIIQKKKVKGYTEENNIPADSKTETYVALKFFIDNWRWGGVPFFIRTGKHLPTKVTEIVITFRTIPHPAFIKNSNSPDAKNQLIIRIQPDEGIAFKIGVKTPGIGFDVESTSMNFKYTQIGQTELPSAYERLLYDCMQGDSSLFTRGDSVDLAWKFVQPIIDEWKQNPDFPLYHYPAGSWGPEEATTLKVGYGDWRYPCKNLNSDSEYCEL